jgi:chromosome segregation protein
MKKLKDEITKVKQETVIMQQANKKLKEENENFGKAQRDLTRTVQKLNAAEQQLSIIQIQNDEAQETLRTLKASEKSLQKELQSTKLELNETRNQKEVLGYALEQAKLERKQTMLSLEKAQERIKEAEQKFEASHQENLENSRRLSSLEGEMSQKIIAFSSSSKSIAELAPVEAQLQQLTESHQKLEAEHKIVLTTLEEKKSEIQQMQSKVNKLVSITRNQEMELRETEEDIEVFEHELTAMQQFIRTRCKNFFKTFFLFH